MSEQWRDVVGWEGFYQVSSEGSVRSLPRIVRCSNGTVRTCLGRQMQGIAERGYVAIRLCDGESKTPKAMRVHRLVAMAFIPNPDSKPQVNHIDSNRVNNRVSNLEWVTSRENILHAERVGRRKHLTKLSADNVMEVRRRWQEGATVRGLAREFGVHLRTMRKIVHGYTRRNVMDGR